MGKVELKIDVDSELLAAAVAAGVDVTSITEDAVRSALRDASDEAKARRWTEQNAEAIQAHRERIEAFGVFGEDLRAW